MVLTSKVGENITVSPENSTCDLCHLVTLILACTQWLLSAKVQLTSVILKGYILPF